MTKAAKPRVLVLDGMWNKTLAVVRSLGESGAYVAVGETTRFATALFSRYASKTFVYPSPVLEPERFMEFLLSELKDGRYDLVIPTEFSTQQLLAKHRADIEKFTGFPFPDLEEAENAHDKAFLMRFAAEHGYETPVTYFIESDSDIETLAGELNYPVLIKPRASSGSRGIVRVDNKENFVEACCSVSEKYPDPIVQELLPSSAASGYGVGALFNFKGEPRAAFVYRRLREYPVSGGPSTLRESVLNDEIKETALSLLKDLKWKGAAMVEFKIDPRDGKPKLLEINPRLWGSLELAVRSGVDIPYMLYKLQKDGDVEPRMDYKVGVRCRWLIPGDLMHFLTNPDRFKMIGEFFRRTDGDDIISLKDPMPVVGRLSSALTLLFDKNMRAALRR